MENAAAIAAKLQGSQQFKKVNPSDCSLICCAVFLDDASPSRLFIVEPTQAGRQRDVALHRAAVPNIPTVTRPTLAHGRCF